MPTNHTCISQFMKAPTPEVLTHISTIQLGGMLIAVGVQELSALRLGMILVGDIAAALQILPGSNEFILKGIETGGDDATFRGPVDPIDFCLDEIRHRSNLVVV